MRVLINALGAAMGGGLRHLTGFLPALSASPGPHSYDVLVRSSIKMPLESDHVRLRTWQDEEAATSLRRVMADLVLSAIRARHYDVFVSLMNFGPVFCPIPHILFQSNALYFSTGYRESLESRQRLDIALRRRWTIEAMRFAELIVTPSFAMTDLIRSDCPGLLHKKFFTLYHGFDSPTWNSQSNSANDAAGWGIEGSPKLLYTSHLASYKNFEVLLQTLAQLKVVYPKIVLILTFDAADRATDSATDFSVYEKMVAGLGIRDNVRFIGRVPQDRVSSLYGLADIFLFPSVCESFGFPMLEAMGSDLPVIASDTPINREICREAALYFDRRDPAACAGCIRSVVDSVEVRSHLADGRRKVLESFDWGWTRYAAEFVNMIETVAVRQAA